MLVLIISISIILSLIAIGWWFLSGPKKVDRPKNTRTAGRFHAVAIECGTDACPAANELRNMRLLSGEAPQLPLPDCDAPRCDCRYVHFDDRRDEDRRHPYAGINQVFGTADQRSGEDRRM
jgi:hypothetical protein